MIINQIRTALRPALLSLTLAASALGMTATPSHAGLGDLLSCFFGGCSYGGGGYGGGGGGGGGGSTPAPVDPTGVIHTVFIVGDAFFPEKVYAQPGDELKFYNLRNSSMRVKADDNSWTSSSMSKNQSWSIVLQSNTKLKFRKSTYGYTSMQGEVYLQNTPSAVAFGDLVDPYGNVIGKDGDVAYVAEGLGYTLAGVSGTLQDVGQGLDNVVGGSGLGLNTDLGLGNN